MWLIEQIAYETLRPFFTNGHIPTAEQLEQLDARFGESDTPRLLTIAGKESVIAIEGIITTRPNFFAMFFGGGNVTWSEIIQAIDAAEADPNVESLTFEIDSPGGNTDGMLAAIKAVQNTKKPTKTIFVNLGASAAFAFGVQSDEVLAADESARIGSVGVVMTFAVDDTIIEITSTEAPDKRPDPTTDAGKKVIRQHLDAIHELIAGEIATARNTTIADVNANFGRGGIFLAAQAVTRKMIDGLVEATQSPSTQPAATAVTTKTEVRAMDLTTLRAEHPALYASIVEGATNTERERCQAHLIAGRMNSAMEIAEEAIKTGAPYGNDLIRAKYDEAGKKAKDLKDRGADSKEGEEIIEGVKPETKPDAQTAEDDKLHEDIADAVAIEFGYDTPAEK